jgi:hypothetical protein
MAPKVSQGPFQEHLSDANWTPVSYLGEPSSLVAISALQGRGKSRSRRAPHVSCCKIVFSLNKRRHGSPGQCSLYKLWSIQCW